MSPSTDYSRRRTGNLYAVCIFGGVLVSAYASFFADRRYYTSAFWVPVVFLLGAVHGSLGILQGSYPSCRGRLNSGAYYVGQLLIVTAIVFLSPSRGFMEIVTLPLTSQAIFNLRPRYSAAIAIYLFGICVAVWVIPFGWASGLQAVLNYSTAFGFTIAFTLVTRQALIAREREAKLREKVEDANRQLRDYAAQAEELATTRERNRLAREIHDGVGHYLTVVKTQLDAAAALLPAQSDRAREVVVSAAKLAADALDDVRRSVGALRTDTARPPLPEALRVLIVEAGLPVAVRIEGVERSLAPAIEHALFRSAQEGLTNIRKHASASAAELTLDYRPSEHVVLAVKDNGRGAAGDRAPGFGLQGIRERIEVLGGRVEACNQREGGFALRIEVPV